MDFELGGPFNVIAIVYGVMAVMTVVRLSQERQVLTQKLLFREGRNLAFMAAFLLLDPPAVLLHELGHIAAVNIVGGKVVSLEYGFYWGAVNWLPSLPQHPMDLYWTALAGNLVTLVLGFVFLPLLFVRRIPPFYRYVVFYFSALQAIHVLIWYPLMTLGGFVGDFNAIYSRNTLDASIVAGVMHGSIILWLLASWRLGALGWLYGNIGRIAPERSRVRETRSVEDVKAEEGPAFASRSTARARPVRTLTVVGSEPVSLDPAAVADPVSAAYVAEVFGRLVMPSPELDVVSDIAERWDVSADGTRYSLSLRGDSKFHGGKPITATDVQYSLQRLLKERSVSGSGRFLSSLIAETSVVDERTLAISLAAPFGDFLSLLGCPAASIVDRANVKAGRAWFRHANGAGPYELTDWSPGKELVLDRHRGHRTGSGNVERVRFLLQADDPIGMYQWGEADVVRVPPGEAAGVRESRSLRNETVVGGTSDLTYLGFNTSRPPFADRKVRAAFAGSVERQRLCEQALCGCGEPAEGFIPAPLVGRGSSSGGLRYDAAVAKQALTRAGRAGWGADRRLLLVGETGTGGLVSQLCRAWSETLDVDVASQELERVPFLERLRNRDWDLFVITWRTDWCNPGMFLGSFHGESPDNYTGFGHCGVDRLLESAWLEKDKHARAASLRRAEEMIIRELPALPLFSGRRCFLVKPRVKGFRPPALPVPFLADVRL